MCWSKEDGCNLEPGDPWNTMIIVVQLQNGLVVIFFWDVASSMNACRSEVTVLTMGSFSPCASFLKLQYMVDAWWCGLLLLFLEVDAWPSGPLGCFSKKNKYITKKKSRGNLESNPFWIFFYLFSSPPSLRFFLYEMDWITCILYFRLVSVIYHFIFLNLVYLLILFIEF